MESTTADRKKSLSTENKSFLSFRSSATGNSQPRLVPSQDSQPAIEQNQSANTSASYTLSSPRAKKERVSLYGTLGRRGAGSMFVDVFKSNKGGQDDANIHRKAESEANVFPMSLPNESSLQASVSKEISVEPADKEKPKLRNWYVKYKQDASVVGTVKAASNNEGSAAELEPSVPKPLGTNPVVNDMKKWVELDYSMLGTQYNADSKTQLTAAEKNFVDKLWNARRKRTTIIDANRVLSIDPELLGFTKSDIRRQEIIYELIVTERDYVQDMRVLCDLIIKKIREKKLMTANGMKKAFSNAEELPAINDELFRNLFEKRAASFEAATEMLVNAKVKSKATYSKAGDVIRNFTVGDVFLALTPYLRTYTIYCGAHTEGSMYLQSRLENAKEEKNKQKNKAQTTNSNKFKKQLSAMKDEELLDDEKQREKDKDLALFLQYCSFKPECKNLDVFSFLIKPVQRICKYPLLLRELIKNTEKSHPDYDLLMKASSMIEKVVGEVNERRRFLEGQQFRMIELRKRLNFDTALVTASEDKTKAKTLNLKNNFDLLGEASRKLVLEGGESGDLYLLKDDQKVGETVTASQFSARWTILCSDVLIVAKVPEKGIFSFKADSDKQSKGKVKFVMKLLDMLEVKAGTTLGQDTSKIGSQKMELFFWTVSFDVLGKLPITDKNKAGPKVSRMTFTFACRKKTERDSWVQTVQKAQEECKKDFEERLRILRERLIQPKQDRMNADPEAFSPIALDDDHEPASPVSQFSNFSEPVSFGEDTATELNRRSSGDTASMKSPVQKKPVAKYGSFQHNTLFSTEETEEEVIVTRTNVPLGASLPAHVNAAVIKGEGKQKVKLEPIPRASGSSLDLFRQEDQKQNAPPKLDLKSSLTGLQKLAHSEGSANIRKSHQSLKAASSPPEEQASFANPLFGTLKRNSELTKSLKNSIPDFAAAFTQSPPTSPIITRRKDSAASDESLLFTRGSEFGSKRNLASEALSKAQSPTDERLPVVSETPPQVHAERSSTAKSMDSERVKSLITDLDFGSLMSYMNGNAVIIDKSQDNLAVSMLSRKEGSQQAPGAENDYSDPHSLNVADNAKPDAGNSAVSVAEDHEGFIHEALEQPEQLEGKVSTPGSFSKESVPDHPQKDTPYEEPRKQDVEEEPVHTKSGNHIIEVALKSTESTEIFETRPAVVDHSDDESHPLALNHSDDNVLLRGIAKQEEEDPVSIAEESRSSSEGRITPAYVSPPSGDNDVATPMSVSYGEAATKSLADVSPLGRPKSAVLDSTMPNFDVDRTSKNKNRVSLIAARFESFKSTSMLDVTGPRSPKEELDKSLGSIPEPATLSQIKKESEVHKSLERIKTMTVQTAGNRMAPSIVSRAKIYETPKDEINTVAGLVQNSPNTLSRTNSATAQIVASPPLVRLSSSGKISKTQ